MRGVSFFPANLFMHRAAEHLTCCTHNYIQQCYARYCNTNTILSILPQHTSLLLFRAKSWGTIETLEKPGSPPSSSSLNTQAFMLFYVQTSGRKILLKKNSPDETRLANFRHKGATHSLHKHRYNWWRKEGWLTSWRAKANVTPNTCLAYTD